MHADRRLAEERLADVLALDDLTLALLFVLLHDGRDFRTDACRAKLRAAGWT